MTTTATLRMIYVDALSYERKDAIEEEMQEAQKRLNISDMGKRTYLPFAVERGRFNN